MDTQILEWVTQQAEDWWTSQRSHTYVWGKGHWNVIGHSGRERILPTLLDEWKDIRMVRFEVFYSSSIRYIICLHHQSKLCPILCILIHFDQILGVV